MDDIASWLKNFATHAQQEVRENYKRTLPFNELISDRWERAKALGFGEGSSIYDSVYVYGDVYAGKETWIGPNVILDGSGGKITIGAFCSISAGVHIYTHDTVHWALTAGKSEPFKASVSIGKQCHIGAQAIIKAGVNVGDQCVIGANTFVNRDIPNNAIVVGSPARIIGRTKVQGQDVQFIYE